MKIIKWALPILLVLCVAAFGSYIHNSNLDKDCTAPVISFEQDVLEISVYDEAEILLSGVSAVDEFDGDVSGLVLVEGISSIRDDNSATVTYAAFDNSGNVSKAERTIIYTDYHSPRFSISRPLVFRSGSNIDIFDYLSAEDLVDGDISDRIKATLVSGDGNINDTGLHEVEIRVTNSMGDTTRVTIPVEVYESGTYNAEVLLTDYIVYIEQGSEFDALSYAETLQAGSKELSLSEKESYNIELTADGEVDTAEPGYYYVTYTAEYGTYKACTRLTVIVEDTHNA